MTNKKPFACLSFDLDNQWSYMKTHGDPGWESYPSYMDIVIPRVLEFLEKRKLKITFFIVGQDAALEKNESSLRSIAEAGHEIGNHSYLHETWLHLYTKEQFEADLTKTEQQIVRLTGQKPIGFRGPGYSLSTIVLQTLIEHGYAYDASTLPTFLGPLARAYYFMTAKLSPEEREFRKQLFGNLREGLRPINPYRWRISNHPDGIIEIPITTMPLFRIPFHVSYLMYINRFSPALSRIYFRLAIGMCQIAKITPSLLLHPLDFLGCDDIKELSFFPAMNLSSDKKIKLVEEIINIYSSRYTIIPLREQAQILSQKENIAFVEPKFPTKAPVNI